MKCYWRHCDNELSGKQTKYCSARCKNRSAVDKSRRRLKEKSVEYLGGACRDCGFDRHLAAMQFHHLRDKAFKLSNGNTRSWEKQKVELDKCILLCANCHAVRHSNDTPL